MDLEYDYDEEEYQNFEEDEYVQSAPDEEQINDEGRIQGIKMQQDSHHMQQNQKKLINPNSVGDPGFDLLISECNWTQIEDALIGDPELYFTRLGKMFNYIVNIFSFTMGQDELIEELTHNLKNACRIFIEMSYIGEHTELRSFIDPKIQISLKIDKKLLGILINILIQNPQKLSQKQAELRGYLPRLLIMIMSPPEHYLCTLGPRETQAYILQKMQDIFLSRESQNFESQQLDIIGYIFYCDSNKHTDMIKNIIQNLRSFLESFLECEDKTQQTQVQVSILNIIQLFIVLTQNEVLNKDFFVTQLHKTLYNAIKFSTPIFSQTQNPRIWSKEPMIRKSMVSLISRIISTNQVDENLGKVLLSDFLFLIEKQKFDFIQSVILPILNSENVKYQPLCIHSHQSVVGLKEYRNKLFDFFRSTCQTQNLNLTLRLQSELLSFDQRELFGKNFATLIKNREVIKVIKQKKEKSQKQINGIEEEGMDFNMDQLFGQDYIEESQVFQQQKVQKQSKEVILIQSDGENDQNQFKQEIKQQFQQQKLQQKAQGITQMNELEQNEHSQYGVAGRWQLLHSFSPQNPTLSYLSVHDAIKDKSNLLFIFDLMCDYQNCKLCIFVEGGSNPGNQQIGVQVQSPSLLAGGLNNKQSYATKNSFFSLYSDDNQCYTVLAMKDKGQKYIMLDLQQTGLNLVYNSEIIAYINFGNLNMSKFGFPFKELTDVSFQKDQLQNSMSGEENFLLGAEIWQFNPQNKSQQDLVIDSQLSQFSQNKSMAELVSYYISQFRLETVHFVPNNANLEDLTRQLQNQGYESDQLLYLPGKQLSKISLSELSQSQDKTILDIYMRESKLDSLKINISDSIISHRPHNLLNFFQRQLGGMVKVARMLRSEVIKKEQHYLQEFFNDMEDLIYLEGFTEEILKNDEFLQIMLGIVFSKHQQVEVFHKGILYLYKAMYKVLKNDHMVDQKGILLSSDYASNKNDYELFKITGKGNYLLPYYTLLLKRAQCYIGKLFQTVTLNGIQPEIQSTEDNKLKELFTQQKIQQIPIKGKPKGVGYGDIQYNANKFKTEIQPPNQNQLAQQGGDNKKNQQDELFGSLAGDYRQSVIGIILKNISCIIQGIQMDPLMRANIQESILFPLLKTLFSKVLISQITQQDKIYSAAFRVIKQLAQYEELIDLFINTGHQYGLQEKKSLNQVTEIQKILIENNSLYRMLESLREQALIFKQTFQEKQSNIDQETQEQDKKSLLTTFLDTFDYLETRLVAAEFITISYDQPQQEVILEERKEIDVDNNDSTLNLHQFYTILMKPIAIGKCAQLRLDKNWQIKMDPYFKTSAATPSSTKMNRLIQELTDLGNSLPIESTNSIFVTYDQDRMDVMRAIIFGAEGTPYAHGAFQYEFFFMDDYPNRPPKVLLSTTGHGKFRFNPNLYACGKVCLSLLGTWGDNWIANVSTILQILVSIMSMVMSEYVMFNEPGWESQMSTPDGQSKNQGYCNLVKLSNIRYAMIDQLRNPPLGFEDVIQKSFYLRKDVIKKEIELWIKQADLPANYTQTQNQCSYALTPQQYKIDLVLAFNELKVELEKLKLSIGKDFQNNNKSIKRHVNIMSDKEPLFNSNQQIIKKYQSVILPLPQPVKYDIDTSYSNSIVQKAFDPTDPNLQNLMSRYIGVLGVDAVTKQSEANVLLLGLRSLGVETAKNIILSGVKRLTLWDDTIVDATSNQFYLWQSDIGNTRCKATISKLRHLNPYVIVDFIEGDLLPQIETCLNQYTVVVVTDDSLGYNDLVSLGRSCRAKNVGIILSQTSGVYARIALDLGDQFSILDKDGETPSEVNIESISSDGIVQLFKNQKHNIQDGDILIFKEIIEEESNLQSLNEVTFIVSKVTRFTFEIGDIRQAYKGYLRNGVGYQQKRKTNAQFLPIEQVINGESDKIYAENMGLLFEEVQFAKQDLLNHLFTYKLKYDQKIKSWSFEDTEKFYQFTTQQGLIESMIKKYGQDVIQKYANKLFPLINTFSLTNGGSLPALDAFMGGLLCQEVLKAITKKYSPIQQVYIHSCEELLPFTSEQLYQIIYNDDKILKCNSQLFQQFLKQHGYNTIVEQRYQPLQIILGSKYLDSQRQAKIFMVGCGAIGCELLKNFAMNGFSNLNEGCIYVTDPDIIENSNLSRQFLFREKHIRKPKAVTAAAVVLQMNPDMQVIARLDRVSSDTADIYHKQFFQWIDCVANALDNVQARLYVDSRCVESDTALVESGTLGPKGHVQVVIPQKTESYGSKRDPEEDNDIPYCTLKMFPESSLHCLEWARDKFEQYFVRKPQAIVQVLNALSQPDSKQALSQIQQQTLELASRCLSRLPENFQQCVTQARIKYERLFKFAIVQLMTAYPLETKDGEGKMFWSAPKRPPKVLNYDREGQWAVQFVHDFALLLAQCYNIQIPTTDLIAYVNENMRTVVVPQFQASKQKLALIKQQIEKNLSKMEEEQNQQQNQQQGSLEDLISDLQKNAQQIIQKKPPQPQQFEKDDDMNHHISFIASSTNARASNYGIVPVDWLWCKLKAGRIVPAMASTTACISALQTIEIMKIVQNKNIEEYKNTFTNLAIPCLMQSEPGLCDKIKINQQEISIWSKHVYKITQLKLPLQHFVFYLENVFRLPVISIKQGAKAIYLAQMLPQDQQQREAILQSPLLSILDWKNKMDYLDLDLSLKEHQKEIIGPKIRLTF